MQRNSPYLVCPAVRIALILTLVLTLQGACRTNGHDDLDVLENPYLQLHIGTDDGAIRSIHDKQLDITYQINGIAFALTTDRGDTQTLTPISVNRAQDGLTLTFETSDFTIDLRYRLGPEDRFIEKWLEFTSRNGQTFFLKNVTLEDAALGPQFRQIHFHDDNTIWQCPINLFLRGEKGGCFAGIEYPYWELDIEEHSGFRLGFAPNYQVPAGETFVSEKYFIGLFRREGIYRYSQGPYPGQVPSPYVNFGKEAGFGTGLDQHFKNRQIPAAAVKPEVLDWGEVWAMQDFMRHVLPDDLALPEEGFWIWQNGWWASLFDPRPEILDRLKQAGIHYIGTAHTWYGRGNHPRPEPYLSQMRIDPMGFPKDEDVAGMPGPAGGDARYLTPKPEKGQVALDRFTPGKYTPDFLAPPAMEALYQYGEKIGVHVSSFSLPGIYFDNRPEWASIDEDGNISEYLFGRKVSCPACDPYMRHMLNLLDHVFTKYQPRLWGFDGRWLSYWGAVAYRPGPKGLGFDTCHAENHGHLPGDNLYKEWKNIQTLLQELRSRHPHTCLEAYFGLKRGGPWVLRYFNCDDNYFETNGAVMNRFQTWHNQNDRFRPPYKNYAAIFGETPKDFQTNLISSISATSYCQLGPGFRGLALEENRDFLEKWRAWATENYAYLKVKRDLFDCPGFRRLDGSAHIIADRGFLFLFPVGAGPTPARALIPLNRWISLDEDPRALYQITEIFPQPDRLLGTYRYGDQFAYDMPLESPVVLALNPAPPDTQPQQIVPLADAGQVIIVEAFTDELFGLPAPGTSPTAEEPNVTLDRPIRP